MLYNMINELSILDKTKEEANKKKIIKSFIHDKLVA